MPRTIRVQVDTSYTLAGAAGVVIHDAVEAQDTSGREEIFKDIRALVAEICGPLLGADYDKGRAMFGIWSTTFQIGTASHTESGKLKLLTALQQLWESQKERIQGFRLIWEGDRQDNLVDDMQAALNRFGNVSTNLDMKQFDHGDSGDKKGR